MRTSTDGEVMWDIIERLHLEWTHMGKTKLVLRQKISNSRRTYKWIKEYNEQHPNMDFFEMSRKARRKWLKDKIDVNYDSIQWIHKETYDYMKRIEEGNPVDMYDTPSQEMLSILAERKRVRKNRVDLVAEQSARSGSEIDTSQDTVTKALAIFQKKQENLSETNIQLLRAFTLAVLNEDVTPAVGGLFANWIRDFKASMAMETVALRSHGQTFAAKCRELS
ncbi:hypothetical protein V1517DRAFT_353212 [Lipomyces orientalis]|uniref:Uncharacterized protein n=1 Tax=Lipomyces orientalis TaxID=1233043 RepID=A0ACC3TLY4_9ASCO